MLIKFQVGGAYSWSSIPFKVTKYTGGIMRLRQVQGLSGDGICQQINVHADDTVRASIYPDEVEFIYPDEVEFSFRPRLAAFTAFDFHCLHPSFPSDNSLCKAYLRDRLMPEWLCRFHKKTMKTFVLFFFSVKLVVLARRVIKERMYTPGGIGIIAAQEDFGRVTKSQRIE